VVGPADITGGAGGQGCVMTRLWNTLGAAALKGA